MERPRILGTYVRERGVISLEEAIFRMTGLTAWRLGLSARGLVRPGYKADVVVFDAQHIADRATYDMPHVYPKGIRWVLVNGQVILRDGERLPVLPGRVLRRAGNSATPRAVGHGNLKPGTVEGLGDRGELSSAATRRNHAIPPTAPAGPRTVASMMVYS